MENIKNFFSNLIALIMEYEALRWIICAILTIVVFNISNAIISPKLTSRIAIIDGLLSFVSFIFSVGIAGLFWRLTRRFRKGY